MYKIVVYQTESADWNWSLRYNDDKMAQGCEGPGGFASKSGAIDNLLAVARVFNDLSGTLAKTSTAPGEYDLGNIEDGAELTLVIESS